MKLYEIAATERIGLNEFDGHTQGPWWVECSSQRGHTVWAACGATGSMQIAACGYAGFDRHNAALIAAAPMLLDALRASYAEIDRLRANAIDWKIVTDDPTTLPAVGRRVIVEHRNSGMTFAAQIDGPDLWALGSFDGERDTYAILSPGDRWAYIPEVQA